MNVLLNLGAGLGVAATGLWLAFGGDDDDAIQDYNENKLTKADNDPRKKTTQTTQEYQKTTQHSKTKYKNPELLSGDPGNLKIDRATYKITCVGCVMDAELQATLNLINDTPISDVNKQTVVSLFMWIEDNLPKEEQLNNKTAVLVNFGRDEGTIKNRGEGQDPFRYDYNNVNPNIQNVIDWFLSKNASPLDFVTRLCNNYGIAAKDEKPQDNKGDIATNPKNPKKNTKKNPETTETDETDPLAGLDLSNSDDKEELERERAETERERAETERIEAEVQRLEQELQNVMQQENATREMLIKNAKAILQAGGNPADVEGWEEVSKKFDITPDDL